MFDKQYRFVGSHAEKVNALTSVFNDRSKAKMFETNINVRKSKPMNLALFEKLRTIIRYLHFFIRYMYFLYVIKCSEPSP